MPGRSISIAASDRPVEQLKSIVGEENVNGTQPLVVTPESIEQVCEVIKLASTEGWKVLPAGAATWLDVGNTLESADLILSTRKLNRIIEHEPSDLVAIAEAGVTLSAFNQHLAARGQWLPLDPPDDGRTTIGGVVATGLGGPQQFGYGPPRRHIIGMKVVLADGQLIKVGGRVVKNVAGYDLSKLFTGSYGTLGVIVEVNFKLRPLPQETQTIVAWGEPEELLESGRRLITARLFPVGLTLVSPQLASRVASGDGGRCALLIKFAGSSKTVSEQVRASSSLLQLRGVGADPVIADRLEQALAGGPRADKEVVFRITVRPSEIDHFVKLLSRKGATQTVWQADVAEGRLRGVTEVTNESLAFISSLRADAERIAGRLVIEDSPAELKDLMDTWGNTGNSGSIMLRIKKQLDPQRMFSPGRFSAQV